MSISVGTDIVSINRIKKAIEKFGDKFLDRLMSQNERERVKSVESIAGIWAAKEAVSKALGCGIGSELGFLDIEISKDSKGRPIVSVTNSNFKIIDSSISISHDKDFAIAVAIVNYI